MGICESTCQALVYLMWLPGLHYSAKRLPGAEKKRERTQSLPNHGEHLRSDAG